MHVNGRIRFGPWLLGLLPLLAGCATFPLSQHLLGTGPEAPPKGEVTQVLANWADGVVPHPDPQTGKPVPGLACRVWLFNPAYLPVAATGKIEVQLFDDAQGVNALPAPREVWNIDQANLDRACTRDGLGWGYDLWLPWSTCRTDVKEVILVVRYVPDHGRPVAAEQCRMNMIENGSLKRPSQMQIQRYTKQPAGKS